MVLDIHNQMDQVQVQIKEVKKDQSDTTQKITVLEDQVKLCNSKMNEHIENVHKDLDSFYESTHENIRNDLKGILTENAEVLHTMQDLGNDVVDLTHHLENRVSCRMVAIGIAVATWSAFVTSSWF